MGYVNSIGGDPVAPNPNSYSNLSITGNITMGWAGIAQSPQYPVTDAIDITSTGAYVITMPDTRNVSVGKDVLVNNYGSYTLTFNKSDGTTIATIAAGATKILRITGNATSAGTWNSVNIGSGTSTNDANALAGYGIVALSGQLSSSIPSVSYSTDQTLGLTNRAYLIKWTGGAGVLTLTNPATLGAVWFCYIRNAGTGLITLAPAAGLIDGVSSITANPGEAFIVVSDGTNFYTVGKIAAAASGLTSLTKSVAGGSDVTLTIAESNFNIINLTGLLTANINVIVSASTRQWIFFNNTTGSFTITVKTASGSGVVITQGLHSSIYADGTNVVRSNDISSTSGTALISSNNLSDVASVATALSNLGGAGLVSPSFTGTPVAPTPAVNDNSTRLATTAYTTTALAAGLAAGLVSPSFTGTPVAPTPAVNDNSTRLATTAYTIAALQAGSCFSGGYINKIRNPVMSIASRGTSGTITAGSPAYTLDGWILFSGTANITWSQSGTSGYPSLKSLTITGNTGVTATRIYQRIESNVIGYIDGQNVTIQALITNNTGASITPILSVDHANSIDNFGAVTNDLSVSLQSIANGATVKVAYTDTAAANSFNGLQVTFDFGSTLNSVAKSVSISNVDVRVTPGVAIGLNTLPPAIEVIDITAEKLRCARYLPSVFAGNTTSTLGSSFYATATSSPIIIPFGVEARIAPTGIIASNAAHIQVAGAAVNTASNAITFSNAGLRAGTINVGQATAATVGQGNVSYFNNASAYILFTGCEL